MSNGKELSDKQKEMVADLLSRTKTEADIDDFSERIIGNAYGDEKTKGVYVELAELKMQRLRH